MSKSKVNRHGWWGVLYQASWMSCSSVVITALIYAAIEGFDSFAAAGSVLLAGLGVWILSAITIVVIALVWEKNRDLAVPLAMVAFLVKILVCGVLLMVVPMPSWVETTPAAIGAVVAIVVWQGAEVITFSRTRYQLYDDTSA